MKFISVLAFAMSLILFPSIALAKGASSGGRASVSSSRSFSSPSKSYSSNRTTKSSTWFSSKDNDIECSDLKRSKHAADKIVYKRYCY